VVPPTTTISDVAPGLLYAILEAPMETSRDALRTPQLTPTVAPALASRQGLNFPVVGVAAAEGGLAALKAFLAALPLGTELGMAFVVLSPGRASSTALLAELVGHLPQLKLLEVEDGMQVEVNRAYLVPPERHPVLRGGALRLLEPTAASRLRGPIDLFFRSLAKEQHELAVGVVLAGGGREGAQGVRALKAAGGLVLVQDPRSCEAASMPRIAIGTGLVDLVLPPTELSVRLLALAAEGSRSNRASEVAPPPAAEVLAAVIPLLRERTGHDFSRYQPAILERRLERRMSLRGLDSAATYLAYAASASTEMKALARDLRASATGFFSDLSADPALSAWVGASLAASARLGRPLRLWCAGCGTGEQAYSLAMLLAERQDAGLSDVAVELYATDLDPEAVAIAQAGVYPASIGAEISTTRLERYFSWDARDGQYRARRRLRELVRFSRHDLLSDPPFSGLDLVRCHNLLGTLNASHRAVLLERFHYALRPGGHLFLGANEGLSESDGRFEPVEGASRQYRRGDGGERRRAPRPSRPLAVIQAPQPGLPGDEVAADERVRLLQEELAACKATLKVVGQELTMTRAELLAAQGGRTPGSDAA
jgi:two-component system CheB/CheR fusion protein